VFSERARPLPPEERRASLVAAAIPLISEHGLKVTTKQIAQAAGVAEGTIFRVFTDKTELIQAAINSAFDPEQTLAELGAIDIGLPLHERCMAITAVLRGRLMAVFKIIIAVRMAPGQAKYRPKYGTGPGPHVPAGQAVPPGRSGSHGPHQPAPGEGGPHHGPPVDPQTERIFAEVVRLLEPDRDRFTLPVEQVAHLLRLLTFSGSHPFISEGNVLTAEQITRTILDGVRRRPDTPDHGGPRC
jgi:AcrR family transcriptional regulator